jgi:hypothetical protein
MNSRFKYPMQRLGETKQHHGLMFRAKLRNENDATTNRRKVADQDLSAIRWHIDRINESSENPVSNRAVHA